MLVVFVGGCLLGKNVEREWRFGVSAVFCTCKMMIYSSFLLLCRRLKSDRPVNLSIPGRRYLLESPLKKGGVAYLFSDMLIIAEPVKVRLCFLLAESIL